ncbi:2-dehydro-3-deoxygluconokinase [Virgibacillus halotolerans]|uniref:sugar kinase n=1 Tax=Virgibacillus halotolerans TaxID=1071053 RepID=UPI00196001A8|nr:sugar kinase [Virgibacillus halotolerans]MBM7599380.1 2-dehydro-3-deoxygluconokinase [Virgibacillus halotolerans]
MNDVITIGESMITFDPDVKGPMKYVNGFRKKVGGAELNVAIGCSRLGLKAGWISRLGNDEFGRYIQTFARGEGIDVSQLSLVESYPTSLNFKEIMEDGNVRTFYYRDKSPTLTMTPADLNEAYFKQAKILHFTGIFPAIGPNHIKIVEQAIALAKRHGLKVSFDPNIRLRMWSKQEARETLSKLLPHVDILLAGDEEMDIIIGESDPKMIIEKAKQLGISYIAIKQGDKGAVGYYGGDIVVAPPVKASKVVDTVGAGDGFNAGILYGILHNWQLKKTLHFANTIGSMVVSVAGDNEGLPYYEDVQERLGEIERIER